VQHAGYQLWGRDDIRVTAGPCGPDTEQVLVEMMRNGGREKKSHAEKQRSRENGFSAPLLFRSGRPVPTASGTSGG
jgi:hypothetical protein